MTFVAVEFIYECTGCGVTGPHRYDGEETACTSCGTPRELEPELIASVLDMQFCDWCQETLPASHTCRVEAPACKSQTGLERCGICQPDLVVQDRDLKARAEAEAAGVEYVSPFR